MFSSGLRGSQGLGHSQGRSSSSGQTFTHRAPRGAQRRAGMSSSCQQELVILRAKRAIWFSRLSFRFSKPLDSDLGEAASKSESMDLKLKSSGFWPGAFISEAESSEFGFRCSHFGNRILDFEDQIQWIRILISMLRCLEGLIRILR